VVICPEGDSIERRLLGLTIGERLLLALAHAGVKKVIFTGHGKRPACQRAALNLIDDVDFDPNELDQDFLLLPADVVFTASALCDPAPGSPFSLINKEEFQHVVGIPDSWIEKLSKNGGTKDALRVLDKKAARKAERFLLKDLRKPIDGIVSKYLNRYISLGVTRWLARTGISPNMLTLFIIPMGMASGVFAAIAEPYWMLVLAGLFFQGQSVFDGCDGEIARVTFRFSHLGQWLDSIGDDVTNYSFCLGLALGQARVNDWPWFYFVGFAVLLVQCMTTGIMYRRMIIMGTGDLLQVPVTLGANHGRSSKLMRAFQLLTKRDMFVFAISCLCIAQLPLLGFLLFAVGTLPVFVGVVINDRRLSRSQANLSP
jgi:phosphatidylglycerophosphate synthase